MWCCCQIEAPYFAYGHHRKFQKFIQRMNTRSGRIFTASRSAQIANSQTKEDCSMKIGTCHSALNATSVRKLVQLFASIEAPALQSVDVSTITHFLRDSRRSELQVEAKWAEISDQRKFPWKESMDLELLERLLFFGRSNNIALGLEYVKDLSDTQMERYNTLTVQKKNRASRHPGVIYTSFRGAEMNDYLWAQNVKGSHSSLWCSRDQRRLYGSLSRTRIQKRWFKYS